MRPPFEILCSPSNKGLSHSSLDYHELIASRPVNSAGTKININAASGNTVLTDAQFSIKDDGLTFSLGWVWNSSDLAWRFAVASKLTPRGWGASTITLTEADGRAVSYQYDRTTNEYICTETDSEGKSVIREKDGGYERFFPASGIREIFNNKGLMTDKVLPSNKKISYYYEGERVSSIKLPSGRTLALNAQPADVFSLDLIDEEKNTYNLATYEVKPTEFKATVGDVETVYQSKPGELKITSSDNTAITLSLGQNNVLNSIEEGGRVWTARQDQKNSSFSIYDGDGNAYVTGYDRSKHLSSFKLPTDTVPTSFTFSVPGQLNQVKDPDDEAHLTNYDADTGLVNELKENNGKRLTKITYNTERGSPLFGVKLAEYNEENGSSGTHLFMYNDKRQCVYEISPAGRITKNIYDPDPQDKSLHLIKQRVVTKFYTGIVDPMPSLEEMERWWRDNMKAEDLQSLQVSEISQDKYGRENGITAYTSVAITGEGVKGKQDNASVRQTLDPVGNNLRTDITTVNAGEASKVESTSREFDKLSRPRAVIEGAQLAKADQLKTSCNFENNALIISHPNGLVEKQTHDAGGLVDMKSVSDGVTNREEKYPRNANGSLKALDRADGMREWHYCDKTGRLQYKVLPGGEVIELIYDERGHICCQKDYSLIVDPFKPGLNIAEIIKNSDALSKYTLFDTMGQLRFEVVVKNVKEKNKPAPILKGFIKEHRYTLSKETEVIEYLNPLSGNELKNISYQTLCNKNVDESIPDRRTRYFYDKDGLLIGEQTLVVCNEHEDLCFTKEYERDGAGNNIREIVYLNKSKLATTLEEARPAVKDALVKRKWYDNTGRLIATLDNDQYLTAYTYYANGKLRTEATYEARQLGIDANARSIQIPEPGAKDKVISYEYDGLGRQSTITNSQSGLQVVIEYDKANHEILRSLIDLKTREVRKFSKRVNIFGEQTHDANARASAAGKWVINNIQPDNGLVISKTDALGNVSLIFYDNNRRPRYEISAEGAVLRFSYDPVCGKPVELYHYYTRLDKDTLKSLQECKNRMSFADERYFDSILKKDNRDRKDIRIYDGEGLVLQQIDPTGARHDFYYNSFSELEAEIHDVDEERRLEIDHLHDMRGNLVKSIKDPEHLRVCTAQTFDDPLNRKTRSTTELGDEIDIRHEGLRKQIQIADEGRKQISTQDAFLRTATETDWSGLNEVAHIYSDESREETITSPADPGRNVTIGRDAYSGTVALGQGHRKTQFVPDVDGKNKKAIYADGSSDENNYDVNGDLSTQKDKAGKESEIRRNKDCQEIAAIDDLSGQKRTTAYQPDVFGVNSVVVQADGLVKKNSFHKAGLEQITESDPDNLKLRSAELYNLGGGKIKITQGANTNESQFSLYQENIKRDVLNREIARNIDMGEGKKPLVLKEQELDAAGNVVVEKDGNNNTKRNIYDKRGNLCFSIDGAGFVVERQYNANNKLIQEHSYFTALTETELKITSSENLLTDMRNLLKDKATVNDSIHQYIYDADGLPVYEINFLDTKDGVTRAAIIETQFNANKERVKVREFAAPLIYPEDGLEATLIPTIAQLQQLLRKSKFADDKCNRITDFCRNPAGKRALKRDPENYVVEKRYDAMGRVVARIHYATKFPELKFDSDYQELRKQLISDPDDRATYYVRDNFGNLRYEIDGEGFVIEHRYDESNRPTDTYHYYFKLTELAKLTELLAKDGVDRDNDTILRSMAEAVDKIKNEKKDVRLTDEYDIAGRTKAKLDGEYNNKGERNKEVYTPNALGLNVQRTDKRGKTWETEFDKAKRPVKEKSPAIDMADIKYNEVISSLSVAKTVPAQVETVTSYDDASNPTVTTVAGNIDGQKREVEKRYNKNNQYSGVKINKVTVDNGTDEKPEPGKSLEVEKDIQIRIVHDFAGREILKEDLDGARTFTVYDRAGRERFSIDAEGHVTEHVYTQAFKQYNKSIRHDLKIDKSALLSHDKGFTLDEMQKLYPQPSDNDRAITFTHDRRGLAISVVKDEIITAQVSNGDAKPERITPRTDYLYNAFSELVRQEEVVDSQQKAITLQFHDHNGNVDLSVSPNGYVTQSTFGMKNIDPEKSGSIELNRINWFKPLPYGWAQDKNVGKDKIISQIQKGSIFVISYDWEYDRRLLRTSETATSGVIFYDQKLDGKKIVNFVNKKSVTTGIEYDEEGEVAAYINDKGEKRYLTRNAAGDVVLETDFPQLVDLDKNIWVIPVTTHLVNAHHQSCGSIVHAMPGNLSFIEGKPVVNIQSTADDQLTLLYMDNRGNARITQTPTGSLKFATYNEYNKSIRAYYWVTGTKLVNGNPVIVPNMHLHGTRLKFNANQNPVMTAKRDDDVEVQVWKHRNSFDECEAEGPDENTIHVIRRFNKAGNCWYSNEDRGIPTLTFHNARGDEVVHFRAAANDDLSCYMTDLKRAAAELLGAEHTLTFNKIQRTILLRDLEQNAIAHHLPWRTTQKKDTPHYIQMAFTVITDPKDKKPYIVFRAPEQKLLVGEFKCRQKGEEKWSKSPITMGPDIWSIDISDLVSGTYEYQLNFYFKDIDKEQDHIPSFTAEGETLLDTGNNSKNRCMWYMRDDQTLVLTGNLNDIRGIELIQGDKSVRRIAVLKGEDGRAIVDLSGQPSGDYSFRLLSQGVELDADVTVQAFQPTYKFDSSTTVAAINGTLPADIRLKSVSCMAGQPLLDRQISFGDKYHHIIHDAGSPIPGVFLYAVDTQENEYYLGHFKGYVPKSGYGYSGDFNKLPPMQGEPFILIRSTRTVPLHALKIGEKTYTVEPWANQTYIIRNVNIRDLNALKCIPISLDTAKPTGYTGNISVRTGTTPGTTMVAREIMIKDLKISRYLVGGVFRCNFQSERPVSRLTHYEWKTNLEPDHQLQVRHNGIQGMVSDVSFAGTGLPDPLYFQQTLPHPCLNSVDILSYDIVLPNGDVIPMGTGLPAHVTPVNPHQEVLKKYNDYLSFEREHLDTSSYDDTYVLYFSPLPEGAKTIELEYADKTFTRKVAWRQAVFKPTAKGIVVSASLLQPGINQLRFKAWDADGKLLNTDSMGWHKKNDEWSYGSVLLRKGLPGNMVFASARKDDQLEIDKPVIRYKHDRYKNVIQVDDGAVTDREFNLFQQMISETTPETTTYNQNGNPERTPLTTLTHYNSNATPIAKVAPNKAEESRYVNNHGDVLRSSDADGVYQDNTFDIFHRKLSVKGIKGGAILSRYLVKDKRGIEIRSYPNGTTEEYESNEEGKCIRHQDRLKNATYYDFNMLQQETLCIHKLLKGWVMRLNEYDLRTGMLKKAQDEDGRRKYWNRNPDPDDNKGVEINPVPAIDEYFGNLRAHIDLAGEVTDYTVNANKQIIAELGKVNDRINANRGKTEDGSAPPPRNIRRERDESGRVTDIIDDGVHVTTHIRYDSNDYQMAYFFIGDDGRIYQTSIVDRDELHRVARIRDTRILLSLGYDANGNRRFAQAYYLDDDNRQWLLRESWFDYTPANRPTVRDGILQADGKIDITRNQGMKLEYDEGLLKFIRELKLESELRLKQLDYDNNNLLTDIKSREPASGLNLAAKEFKRNPDDSLKETRSNTACKVYIRKEKPRASEQMAFDMPTYVLIMNEHERLLYNYADPANPEKIVISDDEKLYEHFKKMDGRTADNLFPWEREDLIHAVIDFHIRGNGKLTVDSTTMDVDHSVLSQVRVQKAGEKDESRSTRTITEKTNTGLPIKEETLLTGKLKDEDETPYEMLDETKNAYSLGETSVLVESSSKRKYIKTDADHDPLPPKAEVHATVTANNDIKTVEGRLPVNSDKHSESYRYIVTNSENCIVYKESADGRNFCLYVQPKPDGEIVLMAYFGTIKEDFKRQFLKTGAIDTSANPPDMMINIDVNNHPISAQYPPPIPSQYRAPGRMTYQQVADQLACPTYAAAIARANHADASDIVEADAVVEIPPMPMVAVETAWNGSTLPMESIVGGLYPFLATPNLRSKPKQVDFVEEFLEIAVAATVMVCAPELLAAAVGLSLSALGVGGTALAYGAAGAIANSADQLIAMGYGSQKGFNLKSLMLNTIASAVSGGMLKQLDKLGMGYKAMQGINVGTVANNVVTAETVALAQRAVLLGTRLESHLDWRCFGAALFNAIGMTATGSVFNQDGIEQQIMQAGSASFVSALTKAGVYRQRLNGADVAAVLGNMVGTGLGSKVYRMEVDKRQEVTRAARDSGAPHAVASVGQTRPMPSGAPANRPTPKPAYATKKAEEGVRKRHEEVVDVGEYIDRTKTQYDTRMSRWSGGARVGGVVAQNNSTFFAKNNQASDPSFMDYVDAFNDGAAAAALSTGKALIHPIDTLTGLLQMSWDGYNALADLAFGISTEGSRQRNFARGVAENKAIDAFKEGNGATRVGMVTEVGSGLLFGAALGAGVGFGIGAAAARGRAIIGRGVTGGEEISAANRLQLEKLKTQYRQNASWMNPSEIKNQKLYNIVDDLYRPGAKYGSGSTADAARIENANPGMKVGEKDHIGKAQRYVRALEDVIQNGSLSAHERMIAENIRLDLLDSLGKKLWYSQTNIPKP